MLAAHRCRVGWPAAARSHLGQRGRPQRTVERLVDALEDLVNAARLRTVAGLEGRGPRAGHLEQRALERAHGIGHADFGRGTGQRVAARGPPGGLHQAGAAQVAHQLLEVRVRQLFAPGDLGEREAGAVRLARQRGEDPDAVLGATADLHPYSSTWTSSPPPRVAYARPGRTGGSASTRPVNRSKRPPWRGHSTASSSSSPSPSTAPSCVQTLSMAPHSPSSVSPTHSERPSTSTTRTVPGSICEARATVTNPPLGSTRSRAITPPPPDRSRTLQTNRCAARARRAPARGSSR